MFVAGNHEYYGSSPEKVKRVLGQIVRDFSNLHVIERGARIIQGVRFVGTTLWFRDDPLAAQHRSAMNDFTQIRNFVPWVFEENEKSIRFLRETVRPGDVVVTHYLPSQKSVHPKYQGSPLNPFFVCDVEDVILERQPVIWVHGHTHSSCTYTIGKTRVVCNPLGYVGYEDTTDFNPELVLDIGVGLSKNARYAETGSR